MNRHGVIHGCGAAIALSAGLLSWLSFWIDPTAQAAEVVFFLSIIAVMFTAYLVALLRSIRGRFSLRVVLLWAAAFRLALLPSQPILETDYYRYLWDGVVLAEGVNPYRYAPQEILDALDADLIWGADPANLQRLVNAVRHDERLLYVLENVNHPEIATIYPPFNQLLFGISASIAPGSVLMWRLLIHFFDGVLIASIALLLRLFQRNPSMVLAYAWSPLVLKEYINTLHVDVIALAALFLAIVLACTANQSKSAAAWACATWSKYFPLLALPFWAKSWRKTEWLCFASVSLLLLASLGEIGSRGLAIFAQRWESNSSAIIALEWLLESGGTPSWGEGPILFEVSGQPFHWDAFFLAKLIGVICVLALAGRHIWLSWRNHSETDEIRLRRVFWVMGAILIFSPVCNPWYVGWIVPFLCFFPRASWVYLCASCFLYYLFFIPEPRDYLPGVRELEYAPFYALLLWEIWRKHGAESQNGRVQ